MSDNYYVFDEMLEYAQDVYEEQRFIEGFDWQAAVAKLVDSDTFTAAQAAAIVGLSVNYVRRFFRNRDGAAPRSKRSRAGVSGRFNPKSLGTMRIVRARMENRPPRGAVSEDVKYKIQELIEDGNGLTLLEYLTLVPSPLLWKYKKELEQNPMDGA